MHYIASLVNCLNDYMIPRPVTPVRHQLYQNHVSFCMENLNLLRSTYTVA